MATMDSTNRLRTAAQFMREYAAPSGINKQDLKDAVNAVDDWVESGAVQTSFNNALPAAYRNAATASQKTTILALVLMRKINRLKAEEDL